MTVHLSFDDFSDYPNPEDWSKDGRYILITLGHLEREREIVTVDVTTNETRVLKTLKQSPVGSFVSPDGRFVAFDSHEDPDSREHDLFLVTSDGRRETTLMQTPDYETLLGWLPDGSGILFHRSAEDSQAIWKLPLRDGRPSGPPELVKDDALHMIGLGFSDDAFFYGAVVSQTEVHMGSFDLETGRVLEALEPIADPPGLGSGGATWSPDGTRLVYFSAEQGRNQAPRRDNRMIVRSLTGEILQDLPSPVNRPANPAWSAHGLVVWERDQQDPDRNGFYHLISLETGQATYLRSGPGAFTVSADGSRLFIGNLGVEPITEYDLTTRTERVLVEQGWHTMTAFAGDSGARIAIGLILPDGDKVVYWVGRDKSNTPLRRDDWALEIVSLSTGETRVITGFARLLGVDWSSDGRYLIMDGQLEGAEDRQLLRVSVEDGSVIVLAEGPERFKRPRVSPDGRHVLTTTGEFREEIWRMTFNKN